MKNTLNTVRLMIEQRGHKAKPTGAEIGVIRNSLLYSSDLVSNVTADELATAISQGKTIQGMIPDFKKGGNTDDHFVEQQIFCLDFDNKTDDERITLPQIHERCKMYNVQPFLISESFSSSDSNPKYHVLFAESAPTTSADTARAKILSLLATFPEADPACKDPSRIIFGTAADKKIETYGDFTDLSALPAPASEPEQPAPKPVHKIKLDYSNTSNSGTRIYNYKKMWSLPDFASNLLNIIDINALSSYDNWYSIMCAAVATGISWEEFELWNSNYTGKKFNPKHDRASYKATTGAKHTGATLTHFAKTTNPETYQAYIDHLQNEIDIAKKYDNARKNATQQKRIDNQNKKNELKKNPDMDLEKRYSLISALRANDDNAAISFQIKDLQQYLIDHNIKLKYNEITHTVDIFTNDTLDNNFIGNFPLFVTKIENRIKADTVLMMNKYPVKFKEYRGYVGDFCTYIAYQNKYNPVLERISSQSWSGTDRLTELYDIMKIDESDSLSRSFVRKWLMQCYCGLHNTLLDEKSFSLDIVLILHGKQGAGKTRLFERLALQSAWFGEGMVLDPHKNDTILQGCSKWICELGELGATLKKDIDILKNTISKAKDEVRAPYGKAAVTNPRHTSFCGTVNDEKFLVDTTGNRRFAVVPLHDKMDIKQILSFNALDLWRQIKSIVDSEISNGKTIAACFRLTDELEQQEERNSSFAKELPGEIEVRDILDNMSGHGTRPMNATEFMSQHSELTKYNAKQISNVLKKLGYDQNPQSIRCMINGKEVPTKNSFVLPCKNIKIGRVY